MKPRVLILHTLGTNRDEDAAAAFRLAGADPHIVPLNELRTQARWDYEILMLPGGFSYADALGAGRLWALDLHSYFQDHLQDFIARGRPVLGVCNGFQALVKAGVLGPHTLTHNRTGRFECRWVTIEPRPGSLWTEGLTEPIDCPIAHGEGNFQTHADFEPAFVYTLNPNGSLRDTAGICNARGNVLGLMPHPENHIYPWQHPLKKGHSGLKLFEAGVRRA